MDVTQTALAELETLVSYGPRFHGGEGIQAASEWLEHELIAAGGSVRRASVELPGWAPGSVRRVVVTAPIERELPAWPMLWSGATGGRVSGRIEFVGPQGLWGDSMTWRRFAVVTGDGRVAGYLHGRDVGPAAPQPLPSGSDTQVAHLAIGRLDGEQIAEWIADGREVVVEIECDAAATPTPAASDNLVIDVPGRRADAHVLLCGHYDSFYNTVGAYDNGSGTIALLHLARRLLAEPAGRPVRIIFFTAEEWHLSGARSYVAQADLDETAFVVNIDGLGRGDRLEAFAAPESFDLAAHRAIARHARQTGRLLDLTTRFPPTTGTDDAAFYRAGVPSLFLTFNDLHRLHQPDDLPNEGIARNIEWCVGLVRELIDALPAPTRVAPPGIL